MTTQPAESPSLTESERKSQPEGMRTLAELAAYASREHSGAALRHKTARGWEDISYAEVGSAAAEIAKGLIALGIERGDRVSILANTRPEWTLCDLGALSAGATVAPIYQTNSPEECQYVLTHSDARLVFCEEEQLGKIDQIREHCPALEHVIAFDGSIEGSITLAELRAVGAEVADSALAERTASVAPNDIATLVYTSGTTGPPKGCMLTHENFLATMEMYHQQVDFDDTHTVFMFLPLAHSLARVTQMVALEVGATIAYWT
ncbi:MAG TPA: AMP-binding protein, partial [Thermoleophilaceae bacterium]